MRAGAETFDTARPATEAADAISASSILCNEAIGLQTINAVRDAAAALPNVDKYLPHLDLFDSGLATRAIPAELQQQAEAPAAQLNQLAPILENQRALAAHSAEYKSPGFAGSEMPEAAESPKFNRALQQAPAY